MAHIADSPMKGFRLQKLTAKPGAGPCDGWVPPKQGGWKMTDPQSSEKNAIKIDHLPW
jgi:hypothetical protein